MRSFALISVLGLSVLACRQTTASPAQPAASKATVVVTKVAKIVFMDKEHACDCTRKRVDDTWAALQTALGTPAKLPVERIHVDTESAKAAAFTTQKPLMVPPGIYFVDGRGSVIELLQGEVDAGKIRELLGR
jgi:hypothetical protein